MSTMRLGAISQCDKRSQVHGERSLDALSGAESDEQAAAFASTLARFLPALKGTTIMVDGTRPQAPYTRITRAEYEASKYQAVEDGTDDGLRKRRVSGKVTKGLVN